MSEHLSPNTKGYEDVYGYIRKDRRVANEAVAVNRRKAVTAETEREKIADAIDPRKAVSDPSMIQHDSPHRWCIPASDLIAASDLIRNLNASPSPDSLRLGILAGEIDGRMPNDADMLREIAGRMGVAADEACGAFRIDPGDGVLVAEVNHAIRYYATLKHASPGDAAIAAINAQKDVRYSPARADGFSAGVEAAAKLADGWLEQYRDRTIEYVSAQKYASDAVADIRDDIRALTAKPEPQGGG